MISLRFYKWLHCYYLRGVCVRRRWPSSACVRVCDACVFSRECAGWMLPSVTPVPVWLLAPTPTGGAEERGRLSAERILGLRSFASACFDKPVGAICYPVWPNLNLNAPFVGRKRRTEVCPCVPRNRPPLNPPIITDWCFD